MRSLLKWGGIGAAVAVVGAAVALVAWSVVSTRTLDGRVAAIKARGEPIVPEDFRLAIAPEADALVELRQAHAVVQAVARSEAHKALDAREGRVELPLLPEEASLLRSVVEQGAEAIRRIDAAEGKGDADWRWTPTAASVGLMAGWSEHRALANLCRHKALLAMEERHGGEALRCVQRMLTLADAAERHPSLIGHLVGVGIAALAGSTAVEIAPDLRVADDVGDAAASPAEVRAVIDRLLDTRKTDAGWLWAYQGERAMQLDMLRAVMENRPIGGPGGGPGGGAGQLRSFGVVFARPFVRGNAVILLDYMNDAIAAIGATRDVPAWKQALAASGAEKAIRGSPRRYVLANILLPSIERSGEAHFRAHNDRACAAVALAARWYAAEHGGELPATLESLVPKYLPAVPRDALLGGNAALRYDPERRIVWHAGQNLRDDNGLDVDLKRTARWNNDNTDTVYPLYRKPRVLPEPEATQPAADAAGRSD